MQESDLGVYECELTNIAGVAHGKTQVISKDRSRTVTGTDGVGQLRRTGRLDFEAYAFEFKEEDSCLYHMTGIIMLFFIKDSCICVGNLSLCILLFVLILKKKNN